MILSEEVARQVITELLQYDALKTIDELKNERIKNLGEQVKKLEEVNKKQQMIIDLNYEIIDRQEKIIKNKKAFEFHMYGGAETINDFNNVNLYVKGQMEFKIITFGAKLNANMSEAYELPAAFYNLYVEFKIF